MSKAKFDAARELIQEHRFDEARSILQTIDHPQAKDWLEKLDRIAPPFQPIPAKKANTGRSCLFFVAVAAILILVSLGPRPSTSTQPTDTPNAASIEVRKTVEYVTGIHNFERIEVDDAVVAVYFPISEMTQKGRREADARIAAIACAIRRGGAAKDKAFNLVAVIPNPKSPNVPDTYIGHAVFVNLKPGTIRGLNCSNSAALALELGAVADRYILDPELE